MGIIPKLKKPIGSLTVLEKEKELSKLRHQTEELIDEMGQESDKKALGTVRQYHKELEKEEQLQQDVDLDFLKKFSVNKKTYHRYLITILHRFIKEETIPKKFKLYVESNDTGIIIGISDTNFYGAFKVSGVPLYDINACKIMAVQVGNTIAKLDGYVTKTEAGVILPDSLDTKKYGQPNR